MHWTIYPVNTGWLETDLGAYFTMGRNAGVKKIIPVIAFYLEGGGRRILVDTGMCGTARANKYHHPGPGQRPEEAIHVAIRRLGIGPQDIDTVLFTHLHWDHCSNMKEFTSARFIVHEEEHRFALNPLPPYYRSYENPILGIEPPFAGVDFELINGEQKIAEGVTAFPTPGHCPGHQSVAVETAGGLYVITGDACMCHQNLLPDTERFMPVHPMARYTNVFQMWESVLEVKRRIREITEMALPSHEEVVLKHERYPVEVREEVAVMPAAAW